MSLSNPENSPSEFAEPILSYPKFGAPANQVAAYLHNPDDPPLPPSKPDVTWDGRTTARRNCPTVSGDRGEGRGGGGKGFQRILFPRVGVKIKVATEISFAIRSAQHFVAWTAGHQNYHDGHIAQILPPER